MADTEDRVYCRRAEHGEAHPEHAWRWHGRWIVADHVCPGVPQRAEESR